MTSAAGTETASARSSMRQPCPMTSATVWMRSALAKPLVWQELCHSTRDWRPASEGRLQRVEALIPVRASFLGSLPECLLPLLHPWPGEEAPQNKARVHTPRRREDFRPAVDEGAKTRTFIKEAKGTKQYSPK